MTKAFNIVCVWLGCLACAGAQETVGACKVVGQILVGDGGKLQKTGLAPVWFYDASDTRLTNNLPLPDFGGRGRKDWERIVAAYPNSLTVYSNYEGLAHCAPQAEIIRVATAKKFYDKQAEMKQQGTNDGDEQVLAELWAVWEKDYAAENLAWARMNDAAENIVLWYNLNPGILYAGQPQPVAACQTDHDGRFQAALPGSGPWLLATHIEGLISNQPGNYFWLLPFGASGTNETHLQLTADNATIKRVRTQMPMVMLPETNGFLGAVGFWQLNRVRDARNHAK